MWSAKVSNPKKKARCWPEPKWLSAQICHSGTDAPVSSERQNCFDADALRRLWHVFIIGDLTVAVLRQAMLTFLERALLWLQVGCPSTLVRAV